MKKTTLMTLGLTLSLVLAACGGGGGGSASTPTAAAQDVTFASVTPGATMTWSTGDMATLSFTVRNAAGAPVDGAAVRVFTLSNISPQDGTTLAEPVAMDLLASGMSGSTGAASVELRLPGHLTEVLVVSTWADQETRQRVSLAAAAAAPVALALK